MGFELRKSGVASVSLWPGAVQTELVSQFVLDEDAAQRDAFQVHLIKRATTAHSLLLFPCS